MRLISSNNIYDVPYDRSVIYIDKNTNGAFVVRAELIGGEEPVTLCVYRGKYDAELSVARMREAAVRGDFYYQFKNATT